MSAILNLIFPKFCYGCGREGDYLCPVCQAKVPTLSAKNSGSVEGVVSLFPYRPPLVNLIKDLKFGLVTDLSNSLVNFAVSRLHSDFPNLVSYWQSHHFILIPIPLHYRRQNWRGFNQSELLGRQIASALNIGFDNQLLNRRKSTLPQSLQTSITSRSQNLHSAFSPARPIIGGNYLLFDDVSTSGATFSSAASVFPKTCSLWCLSLCLG